MKIIIDANIIISAIFGGNPQKALLIALKQDCYLSDEIIAELLSLKDRLKKKLKPEKFRQFMVLLLTIIRNTKKISVKERIIVSRAPKDDIYLSIAKQVKADFLVTGDKDLLTISKKELNKVGLSELNIVTPRRFTVYFNRDKK